MGGGVDIQSYRKGEDRSRWSGKYQVVTNNLTLKSELHFMAVCRGLRGGADAPLPFLEPDVLLTCFILLEIDCT